MENLLNSHETFLSNTIFLSFFISPLFPSCPLLVNLSNDTVIVIVGVDMSCLGLKYTSFI
jgi:hypothetical protein